MDFKARKIRDNIDITPKKREPISQDPQAPRYSKAYKISLPFVVSLFIIIFLIVGITEAFKTIDYSAFLSFGGSKLKTDTYGHTNFLILGIGGGTHDGADLTDTIILASLDAKNKSVALLSIPRDLHIKDDFIYSSRINAIYADTKDYYKEDSEKALQHLQNKVQTTFGIPVQYYIKLDFKAFEQLVDAIGGINVYVEENIYDPYYPKDGTLAYETFSIKKGDQHLDGPTALKYVRSRKTTSDFDRARRQQQVMYAIKDQALKMGTLLDGDKIQSILDILKDNIETNLSVKEILALGSIGKDISSDRLVHRLIHDDPNRCGGFLYTPEKEFFNGAFVLLPAGGEEWLQKYADIVLNHQDVSIENTKISILNSTKSNGAAGETKQILKRFCFEISEFGNGETKDLQGTSYYYLNKTDTQGIPINTRPPILDLLEKLIPGRESTNITDSYLEHFATSDIILELGLDYTSSGSYMNDPFYALPAPKIIETETTEADETTKEESGETITDNTNSTEKTDTTTKDTTAPEIKIDAKKSTPIPTP